MPTGRSSALRWAAGATLLAACTRVLEPATLVPAPVAPADSIDLALFLIGTCGDGNSCIVNSADFIGPGVGPEVIDPAPQAPGDYYLYVDSYYDAGTPGSCGTYTLSVTGPLPLEMLDFSVN